MLILVDVVGGGQVLEEDILEPAWSEISRRHPEAAHTLYQKPIDYFTQVRGPTARGRLTGLTERLWQIDAATPSTEESGILVRAGLR